MDEYINVIKNIVDSFLKLCDFIEKSPDLGCYHCPIHKEWLNGKHYNLVYLMEKLGIENTQ